MNMCVCALILFTFIHFLSFLIKRAYFNRKNNNNSNLIKKNNILQLSYININQRIKKM